MRVFFDTNVLFSALTARGGLCAQLFEAVIAEHELLMGEINLLDLARVLAVRFPKHRSAPQDAVELLRDHAGIVPKPDQVTELRLRGADDAWVLASAVADNADMLVTGDKDLLVLAGKRPLPIVAPRECFERLRKAE